jgi:hypothetical protein
VIAALALLASLSSTIPRVVVKHAVTVIADDAERCGARDR